MVVRRLLLVAGAAIVLLAGSAPSAGAATPAPRPHHVKRFVALKLTRFHIRVRVRAAHPRIVRIHILDDTDQVNDNRCAAAILTTNVRGGELVDVASATPLVERYRSRPSAAFAGRGPPAHA